MATTGIQIGVENEVFLRLREPPSHGMPDIVGFANRLSRFYNEATARTNHPRMHSDIDGAYEGKGVNVEWSLTDDQSILPSSSRSTDCES